MSKPIPTSITLRATRDDILAAAADPDRRPVLITIGHDNETVLDFTLQTTAPDGPDTFEYLGNVLTSLGRGLSFQAHTLIAATEKDTIVRNQT